MASTTSEEAAPPRFQATATHAVNTAGGEPRPPLLHTVRR